MDADLTVSLFIDWSATRSLCFQCTDEYFMQPRKSDYVYRALYELLHMHDHQVPATPQLCVHVILTVCRDRHACPRTHGSMDGTHANETNNGRNSQTVFVSSPANDAVLGLESKDINVKWGTHAG